MKNNPRNQAQKNYIKALYETHQDPEKATQKAINEARAPEEAEQIKTIYKALQKHNKK